MKAAIYCRLSEEDKNKLRRGDESESILNQRTLLTSYALERGWAVYDIYVDEDYAGSDRTRPDFNRLLRDAENRKFDVVLCKSQSRFTREIELVEKYINGLFAQWNVRFVSIVDNADTENRENRKARQLNGLINEWFLEDLSENVRTVLKNKRREGKFVGSFSPYGYRKDDADKNRLVVDGEAASVVRSIYGFYLQGYGPTKIAEILNDNEVFSPSLYKKRNGLKYHPAKQSGTQTFWTYTTVRNILTNRVYLGDTVQGKTEKVSYKSSKMKPVNPQNWQWVRGTHEAIIGEEQWERVQQRMGERTRSQKEGIPHIFAAKVYCGECGRVLQSNTAKGMKYLRCPTAIASKKRCKGISIRLDRLKKAVESQFDMLRDECWNDEMIKAEINGREISKASPTFFRAMQRQKKRLSDITHALQNLYLDKAMGVITLQEYNQLKQAFTREEETLKGQIDYLQKEIKEGEENKISLLHELLQHYQTSNQLDAEVVDTFIERIVVSPRENEEEGVSVKIFWCI